MKSPPPALLAATPYGLAGLLDFLTIDGQHISYVEGTLALRTGHAVLVGGLLVGLFGSLQPVPYPTSESYVHYGTL